MAKKRSAGTRELIEPKGDARYVKRTAKGRFKESDDARRSQKADRPKKAKRSVKSGDDDQGDQRKPLMHPGPSDESRELRTRDPGPSDRVARTQDPGPRTRDHVPIP